MREVWGGEEYENIADKSYMQIGLVLTFAFSFGTFQIKQGDFSFFSIG